MTAALTAEDEAIIADFLRRHGDQQNAATGDSTDDQSSVESPSASKENSP